MFRKKPGQVQVQGFGCADLMFSILVKIESRRIFAFKINVSIMKFPTQVEADYEISNLPQDTNLVYC